MKLIPALGRFFGSGALVAGAAAFLWFYGPASTPAGADIYGPLVRAAGFLPPPDGRVALMTGTSLVNGQHFHYAIGHTTLQLSRVLDHYERQFEVHVPGGSPIRGAFRTESRTAGIVSGFHFGPLLPVSGTTTPRPSGTPARLNDLARFHMVSAYKQDGTVFIEFTPGDDVTFERLMPPPGQDAVGEDLAGVRRPAGLQRVLTIEHGTGPAWSRTLIYRPTDPARDGADFRSAFAASGWSSDPLIESSAVGHYTDGRRECFVGTAGTGDEAVLIVVYRMNPGKK